MCHGCYTSRRLSTGIAAYHGPRGIAVAIERDTDNDPARLTTFEAAAIHACGDDEPLPWLKLRLEEATLHELKQVCRGPDRLPLAGALAQRTAKLHSALAVCERGMDGLTPRSYSA